MPNKVEELLTEYSRGQLMAALEKTVSNEHTAVDNTATSSTVSSGYVPAKWRPVPDRSAARFDDGPLGFVPVVGDILQGAQAVSDLRDAVTSKDKEEKKRKYSSAALSAGLLFVPNALEKAGKPLIKQILKSGKERWLLKQPVGTIALDDAMFRPYKGQNFVHHGADREYVEDILNGETRAMSPSLAVNRWGDYNSKYNPGFYGDGYIFLGDKSMLDNSMLFRGDADTPTVSTVWNGFSSVPSDMRERVAEDIWRRTQLERAGSGLLIRPEDLEKLDIPSSDYYFEAKYHGTLPLENFKHGIFPEPTSVKDEAVLKAFEDKGLPITTYQNVGGMEGYYNRTNALLNSLNENRDLLFRTGGGIHIKPENRGKFTALKKRTGESATWFKEHGTPAQKKMAVFALNSKKWKHGDGGPLDFSGIITTNNRPYNADYIAYIDTALRNGGMNDLQRASVLANIIEESGGNPFAEGPGGFYGLLQWSGERYPRTKETDVYKEIDNQVKNILSTAQSSTDKMSWTHGGKGSGYNSLKDAMAAYNGDVLDDVMRGYTLGYVRPAGGVDSYNNRLKVAKQLYDMQGFRSFDLGGALEKAGSKEKMLELVRKVMASKQI